MALTLPYHKSPNLSCPDYPNRNDQVSRKSNLRREIDPNVLHLTLFAEARSQYGSFISVEVHVFKN